MRRPPRAWTLSAKSIIGEMPARNIRESAELAVDDTKVASTKPSKQAL